MSLELSPCPPGTVELDERAVAGLVQAELRRWVGSGQNLLELACLDMLFPPGKLLRPRLCLWTVAAFDGDPAAAASFAAGLECIHVASLIHDDIVDQAPTRRGRASTAEHLGVCQALLAGDGLVSAGYVAMLGTGLPTETVAGATRCVLDALRRIITAAMREALLREDLTCSVPTVLDIIHGKTAALTGAACQAGAILAGATPEQVEVMGVYGENLGMAFQIRDDLLPYTVPIATALSDVTNRQPTLPILLARDAAGEADLRCLREVFHGDTDPATAHRQVGEILSRTGALDRATELARSHADRAGAALSALPESPSRDRLAELATTAVDRER